jgi:hypothetical protein
MPGNEERKSRIDTVTEDKLQQA